ncbi:hypothetical protein KDW49_05360 [Burkholderia dolosa]|uniref:hypothetical protein n=1 Tax=Burkholderia dolosa TaxID=152500 RepID=UPI001B92B118|nr:hypothetical protein [Burkholderia dolosa]MBR8300142.1 hypothetical protein [Burkholderia dolosa]
MIRGIAFALMPDGPVDDVVLNHLHVSGDGEHAMNNFYSMKMGSSSSLPLLFRTRYLARRTWSRRQKDNLAALENTPGDAPAVFPRPAAAPPYYSTAFTISSITFFASPNTIIVLSM